MMLLLTGCRKDLCYNHGEHALKVRVDVDADYEQVWERPYDYDWSGNWLPDRFGREHHELCPEKPDGVRVGIYHEDGSYREDNLEAKGGILPLNTGNHSLLFYNNDTEYIVFDALESSATAIVTTRTRTRATYNEVHDGEQTVNPPDMLYGEYVDSFDAVESIEPHELPVMLRPLVYTYLVRYEFDAGLNYVGIARGALSGMAGTAYLKDGRTGDDEVTLLYDCTVENFGVEAVVTSFGVPGYKDESYVQVGTQRNHCLNLEVRLKNGKIMDFSFDISGQMLGQPRGGVITVGGITISDEDGAGGDSGFDVTVEGWGEYHDEVLSLN